MSSQPRNVAFKRPSGNPNHHPRRRLIKGEEVRYFFFGSGARRSELLSTVDVDRAGVQIRPSPFETQPKPRGTAFPA